MRFHVRHTFPPFIIILGLCIVSCERGGPSGPGAPAFALSDTSIDFSDESNQQVVTISNLSSDPLDWRILSSTASWLSAFPTGGIVQPGATETLVIQVDRAVLPIGTFSAELQIGAAGQSALIDVFVQETQASPAVAVVQPSVLTIGPLDASQVVELTNTGGSTLTWTLNGPSWVTLAPGSGSVAPGDRSQILVTPDRTGLTHGTYFGTLQFASNGGSPTVALELVVSGFPALALDPDRLDFGGTSDRLFMHVRNDGDVFLQWSAISTAAWIGVSPASGVLPPGMNQLLTVDVSRSELSSAHNEATIEFTSNAGSAVAVVVAEAPSGPPLLRLSPASLNFQESTTELFVSLGNDGDEPLVWSAEPDASWISLPVSAGTVPSHSSASVTVRVSRSGLTAGTYQSALRFASNGGSAEATIAMTVSGSPPPPNIVLSPTSLDFGSAGTELPVVIQNTGEEPLDWLATPADGFASVSPSSGRIEPGDSQTVAVRVSRSGLSAGVYETSIQFDSNGGNRALAVTLRVDDVPAPGVCDSELPPGTQGPISAKVLACGADTNVGSATTHISTGAQTLVLVWVGSATEDATDLPMVQGGGMMWDLVATNVRNADVRRLSVFRGTSSTPSSGSLTIDFNGQEQMALAWGVVEYSGVDVSGVNGSGAVVQVATGSAEVLETFAVANLMPFSGPSNATVGGFFAGADDLSPGAGYDELFEAGAIKRRLMVEFQPRPDTKVDANWLNAAHWLAIALELKSR